MAFLDAMKQISELEAKLVKATADLKKALVSEVENKPFHGELISDGKNNKPLIGILKLSQLVKSKNWTPEYHFPQEQGKIVAEALDMAKSVKATCELVKNMLKTKAVMLHGSKHYLNEDTLQVLKDSELGKYVTEEEQ